ncbi:sigma-70 family RNA polymerase sigma factor [Stackebrandtia soli]|uniref:sigma-70 family RNA polymerase sigma factor n=1 Tax=Stackebrandtia soli TaxID=1892856 RepID=UPI0039E9E9D5
MPGTVPVVTTADVAVDIRVATDTLTGGLSSLRRMLAVDVSPPRVDVPQQVDSRMVNTQRKSRPSPRPRTSSRGDGSGDGGQNTTDNDESGSSEVKRLVAAAQAGDVEAFGRIYDRYNETVYRFIYFRVGNRQLAEDLASETFLRALRRIASFTWQGRDFGAWLVTIARNLVADHFKSGRYRLEMATAEILDIDREERSPEGDPESMVCDKLTNITLLRAVQELNPDQQECIILRFLQGFTVAETARAMSKNEGAIKALQYRAVRTLARLLPEGFSR